MDKIGEGKSMRYERNGNVREGMYKQTDTNIYRVASPLKIRNLNKIVTIW